MIISTNLATPVTFHEITIEAVMRDLSSLVRENFHSETMLKEKELCLLAGKVEKPKISIALHAQTLYAAGQIYKSISHEPVQVHHDIVHHFESQGSPLYMEDRVLYTELGAAAIYAVFDGHTGAEAADFVQAHLPGVLARHLKTEDIHDALQNTFLEIDSHLKTRSGTTATVVFKQGNEFYVANVGDSRAILMKKDGPVEQCSEDAKIMTEGNGYQFTRFTLELINRVNKTFSEVIAKRNDGWRMLDTNGNVAINMVSSLGDFHCRPHSTPVPKISGPYTVEPGDRILIASDGLFDALTTAQVHTLASPLPADRIGHRLGHIAMGAYGKNADNTTILTIEVHDPDNEPS